MTLHYPSESDPVTGIKNNYNNTIFSLKGNININYPFCAEKVKLGEKSNVIKHSQSQKFIPVLSNFHTDRKEVFRFWI